MATVLVVVYRRRNVAHMIGMYEYWRGLRSRAIDLWRRSASCIPKTAGHLFHGRRRSSATRFLSRQPAPLKRKRRHEVTQQHCAGNRRPWLHREPCVPDLLDRGWRVRIPTTTDAIRGGGSFAIHQASRHREGVGTRPQSIGPCATSGGPSRRNLHQQEHHRRRASTSTCGTPEAAERNGVRRVIFSLLHRPCNAEMMSMRRLRSQSCNSYCIAAASEQLLSFYGARAGISWLCFDSSTSTGQVNYRRLLHVGGTHLLRRLATGGLNHREGAVHGPRPRLDVARAVEWR
jgi:hypothetical protein